MNIKNKYQGAEAIIYEEPNKNNLVKERIKKSYRISILDERLRKLRTRSEAKLIKRLKNIIPVPEIIEVNEQEKKIVLEQIPGKRLSENLENLDYKKISKSISKSISKMHNENIIHGDLTTSNMILSEKNKRVYFIDFGLGFYSKKTEDKAVDVHLLKKALEAKHPLIYEQCWEEIIKNYNPQQKQHILTQLEKVESRGRYKRGS